MTKEIKKKVYQERWASIPLRSPEHGALKKVCEATGLSDTSVRKALRGDIISDNAFLARKVAYEMYGFILMK